MANENDEPKPGNGQSNGQNKKFPVIVAIGASAGGVHALVTLFAALPNDTVPGKVAESAAKAAIEADGYRAVRILQRATGGEWRARGLRGATEVGLTVDGSGNVSAD